VVSDEAVRMSGGKLFHAVGPATLNARLPRRCLVRGTTRSPRAEERRVARVETVVTGHAVSYLMSTVVLHQFLVFYMLLVWLAMVSEWNCRQYSEFTVAVLKYLLPV